MEILQILKLLSNDSAYGGPTTVAANQCNELASQGNKVSLVMRHSIVPARSTMTSGVARHLFRARSAGLSLGFAGTFAPGLVAWLCRNVRRYDVVHVHSGRDLVTLPASAMVVATRRPLVVQTHGMIDPSEKLLALLADPVLTRPLFQHSPSILLLTDVERAGLLQEAGPRIAAHLHPLVNGVPRLRSYEFVTASMRTCCSWPDLKCGSVRKSSLAAKLHRDFPRATFSLVGLALVDADIVAKLISELGAEGYCRWEGPIPPHKVLARLLEADTLVLPSFNEPLLMSVLEAMSTGMPAVVTQSCGLASATKQNEAGIAVGDDLTDPPSAVGALIGDRKLRRETGNNAFQMTREDFSIENVARELELTYQRVLN
jgi:Glycosyl transferases group 1/Glycosyl transferase 4-like domain